MPTLQWDWLQELRDVAVVPERFANDNAVGGGGTSADYAAFIAGEQKVWSDIVKRVSIKAD